MKSNKRWVYLLIGLTAFIAIVLLLSKTQRIISPQETQITQAILELQKLNSDLEANVLRLKTGESNNYDRITETNSQIEKKTEDLIEHLGKQEQKINALQSDKKIDVEKFKTLFTQKRDKVEDFKTQYAILRNSTQFLHTGATTLVNEIQKSPIKLKEQIEYERILNKIYTGVVSYLQNSDPHRGQQILRDLDALKQTPASLSRDFIEENAAFVKHVEKVLELQVDVLKLHSEINAINTSGAIIEMLEKNHSINSDRILSLEFLQRVLMFFLGALILIMLFMAYKILLHYQEIKSTSEKLEDAYAKLKESQVHQVQTEKMSALGQMVAGIAHEINTPLAYLKATFNIIQEQLPPLEHVVDDSRALSVALRSKPGLEDLHEQITKVEEGSQAAIRGGLFTELGTLTQDGIHGVDQISEIVTNLKNFSRLDREKVTGFSVESGLDSTLLLARNIIKYTVTVEKDYGYVPSVLGAPSQINQVFLNLITNASHAMPQRSVEENIIRLRTRWLRDSAMVLIEIEDNGNGIAPENMSKIFDPFFTTKPIGQGTGMGLSISYKIIKEHGGRLEVESEVGKGTKFSILLPIESHNLADTLDPEQPSSSHQALVD